MGQPPTPHYNLANIKDRVRAGDCHITRTAVREAWAMGLDRQDIVDCVLQLTTEMLHKSMPSTDYPGMWQDVYHAPLNRRVIYLKVQEDPNDGWAIIIQFKEK